MNIVITSVSFKELRCGLLLCDSRGGATLIVWCGDSDDGPIVEEPLMFEHVLERQTLLRVGH